MTTQKLPPNKFPSDPFAAHPNENRSASEVPEPLPLDDPFGPRVKDAKPDWMTQDIEEPARNSAFGSNSKVGATRWRIHPLWYLCLLVLAFGTYVECHNANKKRSSPTSQSTMAWIHAKSYVEQQLKSPESADFPFLGY